MTTYADYEGYINRMTEDGERNPAVQLSRRLLRQHLRHIRKPEKDSGDGQGAAVLPGLLHDHLLRHRVGVLILLQQETFQLHREIRMFRSGISENQIKTIRVLNKPELIHFFTALEDRG